MEEIDRVNYYIGECLNKDYELRESEFPKIKKKWWGEVYLVNEKLLKESKEQPPQIQDLAVQLKGRSSKYLSILGDVSLSLESMKNKLKKTKCSLEEVPTLVKSRKRRAPWGVLFPINEFRRHFNPRVFKETLDSDIPWEKKHKSVVWRGTPTGIPLDQLSRPAGSVKVGIKRQIPSRLMLVKKWSSTYDVSFSYPNEKWGKDLHPSFTGFFGNYSSIGDQLQHKYIVDIEGHDVSTGLKWKLLSNSLVIMPFPQTISWLMEDKLVPYEHYVPVDSTCDNLDSVLDWCKKNDSKCKKIAQNATKYMEKFMDLDFERRVQSMILDRYDERVTWV